ncbi:MULTISPECIES: glycosyltransferase family 4 protein [Saccharothrix]|uniref:glycosyltransferase family 4 protein n=1 Tax=Saccharothrix TaxID=2071 RepID=UPI001160F39C|nr:glycosyltransferase family 4 protein [Saccharothrix sp. CB00851]
MNPAPSGDDTTPGPDPGGVIGLVVRDLGPGAVTGADLRNRGLAHALRRTHPDSVVFEAEHLRAEVGCAQQCAACSAADLADYGSDRPDPFHRQYCRRACASFQQALDERGVGAVWVSDLQQHRYFHAARAAGVRAVGLDMHNSEADNFHDNAVHPRAAELDSMASVDVESVRLLEDHVSREARVVTFVSHDDEERFRARCHPAATAVVPNSVRVEGTGFPVPDGRPARPDLLFLGHLDYFPNVEAAVTLADEVLPGLRRHRPEATLLLAGKYPNRVLRDRADRPGVRLVANPATTRPLLTGRILVVPLRLGGGSRLKILEAMAACVPVVATAKGAEGLRIRPDEHYLLSGDDPGSLVAKVLQVLDDPEADRRRRLAAHGFVRDHYSWEAIEPAVASAMKEMTAPEPGGHR